jgi:Ni,Fe-hydrogenase III large subunit
VAEELGLVGPVARASGCDRDVRRDHPHGIYRFAYIPVAVAESGDVMARVMVRWLEILRSIAFVLEQLVEMEEGGGDAELGLALAMRESPISDFPLCNKSFNLSYAGHDL